jgi:energy-coupling factor transport system permease protein
MTDAVSDRSDGTVRSGRSGRNLGANAPPGVISHPDFEGGWREVGRGRRHPASWRALHPGAWWLWAGGLALVAMRTTNLLLLGLIVVVVAVVVAARRSDAPWARSFGAFLKLGVFVIAIRLVLQILVGQRVPGTTLFTLPAVPLPSWMAGLSIGGPVTAESLVEALQQGVQLATVLVCFGAVNTLCSPYRMLQALPAALYEAGVAVTVALTFAPQAIMELQRVREARRLRGRPAKGLAFVRGLAVPVLEGGLDRSLALAASMDARGYGRRAGGSRARRTTTILTAVGLLAVCVGAYLLAGAGVAGGWGLPLLGMGAVALAVCLFASGRRSVRTRYRPDPWRWPEWLVSLSGAVALAATVVAGRLSGGAAALTPATTPLSWPTVPLLAALGVLVALTPAVAAPRPRPSTDPGDDVG